VLEAERPGRSVAMTDSADGDARKDSLPHLSAAPPDCPVPSMPLCRETAS